MKNSLLLFAGAAALSLASCSSNTTETTSTTMPADSTGMTTTTATTSTMPVSDDAYHMRGNRMADKFAADMKISNQATIAKLREAYYDRSKRYDELKAKYQADTAGMAAARRQYMMDTDKEFQTVLVVPAQYQAYQSSQSTYDEANNLDTAGQTAAASSATMPAADSSSMSGNMPTTAGKVMEAKGMVGPDNEVAKSKMKLENGAKVKVKDDGTVKVKTADGEKTKM